MGLRRPVKYVICDIPVVVVVGFKKIYLFSFLFIAERIKEHRTLFKQARIIAAFSFQCFFLFFTWNFCGGVVFLCIYVGCSIIS